MAYVEAWFVISCCCSCSMFSSLSTDVESRCILSDTIGCGLGDVALGCSKAAPLNPSFVVAASAVDSADSRGDDESISPISAVQDLHRKASFPAKSSLGG